MNDMLGWQQSWTLADSARTDEPVAAACSRTPDQLDVFWIRPDGAVAIRSWLQGSGGWQDAWALTEPGSAAPGAVTARSRRPDQLDVLWVGADGSIGIRSWFGANGWQPVGPLAAPASAAPGAVVAYSRRPDQLDVFWIRPDGAVAIRSWLEGSGGWQDEWALAGAGSAAPGALAAISRRPDEQLDVFWVRPDGAVAICTWFAASGWQPPAELQPAGAAAPGELVTCSRQPDQLDVYWLAPDGSVRTVSWLEGFGGWQQAWSVAPANSAASSVAAYSRRPDQLDVFWTGRDGGVAIRSWFGSSGWQDTWPLVEPGTACGGVVAVSRLPEMQLDVFWTAPDATVRIRSWFGPDPMVEAQKLIDESWVRSGGAAGPLGIAVAPTTARLDTFTQQFRGGEIAVRGTQVSAVARTRIRLEYAGMHCFGSTGGPGDDEMYAVIGVYPPEKGDRSHVSVKVPDNTGDGTTDMNDGSSSTAGSCEVWSGPPQDLIVSVSAFEHDEGVPSGIKTAVDDLLVGAITAVAGGSLGIGAAAGGLALELVPTVTSFVADKILGLGDDAIGSQAMAISFTEQVGPLPPLQRFAGLDFTHQSPLLTDGDASYKLYFRMIRESITVDV